MSPLFTVSTFDPIFLRWIHMKSTTNQDKYCFSVFLFDAIFFLVSPILLEERKPLKFLLTAALVPGRFFFSFYFCYSLIGVLVSSAPWIFRFRFVLNLGIGLISIGFRWVIGIKGYAIDGSELALTGVKHEADFLVVHCRSIAGTRIELRSTFSKTDGETVRLELLERHPIWADWDWDASS